MIRKLLLFIVVLLLVGYLPTKATNYSAVASGNWSNSASWIPVGIPGSKDTVTIGNGIVINADGLDSCLTLTIAAASLGHTGLSIGNYSVCVGSSGTGAVIINAPTGIDTSFISINSGSLTCGVLTIGGGSKSGEIGLVLISKNGNVNCSSIAFSGTTPQAQFINLSNGAIFLSGTAGLGAGGTFECGTGTVYYTSSTGGQNIGAYTYYTLGTENTSGVNTAPGNVAISAGGYANVGSLNMGVYTLTINGTLIPSSTAIISGTGILNGSGTIEVTTSTCNGYKVQYTISNINAGLNVSYAQGATVSGTYTSLVIAPSATVVACGNLIINGPLTINQGGTLNLSTYTLAGTLTSINNNGTILTECLTTTSSTPLPVGISWTGTVKYGSLTGGQTVVNGNYTNLSLGNSSGADSASGQITVSGNLSTISGGTFNMLGSQLLGNLNGLSNGGIIATQCLINPPLPSGVNWGGTIEYNSPVGGQSISSGTYTNLILAYTSGTNSLVGTTSITGSFISTSGTLNVGNYSLNIGGSVSCSSLSIASGAGSLVTYNKPSGGQNILPGPYTNLAISNLSGVNTACANMIVNGELLISPGATLDMATYILGGTFIPQNNGTLQTENTSSIAYPSALNWGGTVLYGSSAGGQIIVPGNYNRLTTSNTSAPNFSGGNFTVNNLFNTGSIDMGVNTLTINGTLIPTSSAIISGVGGTLNGTGTIQTTTAVCNGYSAQYTISTISPNLFLNYGNGAQISGTFSTLTIAAGANVSACGNISVNGPLVIEVGGLLNLSTNTLSGSIVPLTMQGTISTECLSSYSTTPIPSGLNWMGTVIYGATNGGQTIVPGTYNNLTLNNTNGINSLGGNLKVNGTFTPKAGTLALGSYNVDFAGPTLCGTVQVTSAGNSTVTYSVPGGGQSVLAGSYMNLVNASISGVNITCDSVKVNSMLQIVAGGTLAYFYSTLSGPYTLQNNGQLLPYGGTETSPINSIFEYESTAPYFVNYSTQSEWAASIYTASSLLNTSNLIQSLCWEFDNDIVAGGLNTLPNYKIYLAHTTASEFGTLTNNPITQNTNSIPITDLTEVFSSSTVTFNSGLTADQGIIFNTPFAYDGKDNLLVYVQWGSSKPVNCSYIEPWTLVSTTTGASLSASSSASATLPVSGVVGNYIPQISINASCGLTAGVSGNTPSTISGTITDTSGNPVSSGVIKLYQTGSNKALTVFDSVQINPSGSYVFENVPPGSGYLLQANCTSTYPNTLPTYNDSTPIWDSATTITVTNNVVWNIQLLGTPVLSGTGHVSGVLVKGDNSNAKLVTADVPITGVDISFGKKPKPGSHIVAYTTTNSQGVYDCKKLPVGDYQIFVDIPGLPMDSTYSFTVSATDTAFPNLNFIVDTNRITINGSAPIPTGVSSITTTIPSVEVYPNPFTEQIVLNYNVTERTSVTIEVYNYLGQKVTGLQHPVLETGKYTESLNNICTSAGIYLVKTIIGSEVFNNVIIKAK